MNLTKAYKMVYEDLMSNNSPNLFKGKYDAKNGSEKFMHGIITVIEFIASKSGVKSDDNTFYENMTKSKLKTKEEHNGNN